MPEIPPGLGLEGTRPSPRGRGLMAAQTFAPGDAIAFFHKPSIAIPDSPHMDQTCSHCLYQSPISSKIRACTGCKTAAYCSTACQKADWNLVHSKECKVFKKVRTEGHECLPTPVRALVRMLLKDDMTAAAAEMEGHVEQFRGKIQVWQDMELQAMAALHYMGRETNARSVAGAVEMLCKLQVNSFNRLDVDIAQSGLFINSALAMVNHSCVPNAFVQFIGRKAVLKAYRAIMKNEEIEISYIDCALHRSQRRQSLKDRYHFDCMCLRCRDDLDVYQICQGWPHLDMNIFSLTPDLDMFRDPPIKDSIRSNKTLQNIVEEIYPICSAPLTGPASSNDRVNTLRRRWKMCEPLRKAGLFAVEPLTNVLVEAEVYFGELGNFPYSLAVSCFLALYCEPFRNPAPFSPQRVKGLVIIAKLLSNAVPVSTSNLQSKNKSAGERCAEVFNNMDHATIASAALTIAVFYAPLAHSEDWQVYREAVELLKDVESLPGREQERALLRTWTKDQNDIQGRLFFHHAVKKPIRELSEFALGVMDSEFGS